MVHLIAGKTTDNISSHVDKMTEGGVDIYRWWWCWWMWWWWRLRRRRRRRMMMMMMMMTEGGVDIYRWWWCWWMWWWRRLRRRRRMMMMMMMTTTTTTTTSTSTVLVGFFLCSPTEVGTKWQKFWRRHIHMHLPQWKGVNFDYYFTEVYSHGSN